MRRDLSTHQQLFKVACGGVGFGWAPLHASGKFAGPFLRANKKPAARWEPLSRISADAGALYVRTTGTSQIYSNSPLIKPKPQG